ncbi:MAG TPA: helix-turn-helix domain-containing protein [Pseudomonadota bacterium]|nr:helix-turn-helix domain-containing protein [Pseudomonadota bacterium]
MLVKPSVRSEHPAFDVRGLFSVFADAAVKLFWGLWETAQQTVCEMAYQGAKRALAESDAQRWDEHWMDSTNAAKMLGFPSRQALQKAMDRNPDLAAIASRTGKRLRFRRTDVEAFMAQHSRQTKGGQG